MAWNPQGGGGQGPWGQGPRGGGGGGQAPNPPDFDEFIKRGQNNLKKLLPSGAGVGRVLALVVLVVAGIWLMTGMYRVQPGEQGVELLFGKFVKTTGPGLHFWFPGPIGETLTPYVERTNVIQVGFRKGEDMGGRNSMKRKVPQESLMLTRDQNIIDVEFVVQWRIKNAADFLFNIRTVRDTIKVAAESAMREVVGQMTLEGVRTENRGQAQQRAVELLQQILDLYGAGVIITEVKLQDVSPPKEVSAAFADVQSAKQDQSRLINEAKRYQNDIVPRAEGEALRMIQQAEAYKKKVTQEAIGEAKRFTLVYDAYAQGKDVTRKRLYLERMQDVLGRVNKVIIDKQTQGSGGVVPYLPLNELGKRGASK